MTRYEFNISGRRGVTQAITNHLFDEVQLGYRRSVEKLIEENFKLTEEGSYKIAFQGMLYIHSEYHSSPTFSGPVCDVEHSLHKRMFTLSAILLDTKHRRLRTDAYLGRMLKKCRTIGDMFLLLPEPVFNAVPSDVMECRHSQTTLSKCEVVEFMETNQRDTECIEMQMAINLVTRF